MKDDRYEFKEKIGQGGIGAVYRAFDRRLNREVAIKRVLPEGGFENQGEAIAHLLKEATSLSSVQHPHIVTVYDAGVDEEGPYVVMELLAGRTLDEMVERGSLTYEDFREVAIQTQEALIAAQDLDLVHRDLKPTNVMVTWLPSGKFQMKLVDFGLAKFSPKPSLQTIDHGDAVFGSIHFMAPEQFERTPLDQRTDMYSMGCMYYFALTGIHPFNGETAPEVMAAHLQHRLTPLSQLRPDLPAWLTDWVMWHIERKMDNRPSNARESLQKFLMTEQQNSDTPEDKAPEESKRPKFIFPGSEGAEDAAPPAAQPIIPPAPATPPDDTEDPAAPAAPETPAEVPTSTAPQPIEPPPGQKPSIHTTSQQVTTESAAAPATPEPAPAPAATPAPPPPPAPAPAAPPQAAPPAPATPLVTEQPTIPLQTAPTPARIQLTGSPPPAAPAGPTPTASVTPAGGPSTVISGSTKVTRGGMSNAAKATIAAVLLVAVVLVAIVLVGKNANNKEVQRFNDLVAQVDAEGVKDLPTTADDVQVLLRHAISLKQMEQRPAIYQRLLVAKASDGSDLDKMIAEFACNEGNAMVPDIRVKLINVVQGRKAPSSLEHLLKHAQSTTNTATASAALDAAARIATDKDLPGLIRIIEFNNSLQVRQAAKKVIISIAERSDAREELATALVNAYERGGATEGSQLLLIELLGAAGTDRATEIVKEALKSSDRKTRLAGVAALGNWADDDQFETLLDFMSDEEDDSIRSVAFDAAFQFLRLERERDEFDLEQMWKMLAREAVSKTEKMKLVTGLANNSEDWAFAVVEFFVEDDDDDVSFRADRALEHMEEKRHNKESRSSDDDDE